MKRMFSELSLWIKWKIALWRASRALASRKREFPGCESAMNAWPTTGAGSLSSGYVVQGVTTIVWGSQDLLANLGGVATTSSRGIVTRFSEKPIVDNIKLPNGDGLTSSRVQIIDGYQWDVTIRDDTGFTVRPKIGNTVLIYDGAGFISAGAGGTPTSYIAVIVEASYDAGPKQAGEMHLTVENLTLITEAQTAN